ncbi:hypothetical protein ES702_02227 [subsurface metagenome]
MSFNGALKQFNENYRLFGLDPKTQTEKFNLYNGLANLARGLQSLESQIYQINNRLGAMEQKLNRL